MQEGTKKFVKALEEPRPKNFKGEKDRLSQHRASIDPKMKATKNKRVEPVPAHFQHFFHIYSIFCFIFQVLRMFFSQRPSELFRMTMANGVQASNRLPTPRAAQSTDE